MSIEQAANIHSTLQDTLRIRIINLMLQFQPICAIDVMRALDITPRRGQHHFMMFQQYKLCTTARQGSAIFYRIKDEYYDTLADFLNHIDDIQLDWDENAFKLVRKYWYRGLP